MSSTSLVEKVKNFPMEPGVYQMYDAPGHVIYVGKARNLRDRVSSYFRKKLDNIKTQTLMSQVADIQVTITRNENEALLLESNLIKKYHPRYNVLLRDDKSYPYLYLSSDAEFPRLDFHRGAKKAPGRYFGPYPNAGAVRDNLTLIQKLFRLRQCNDSFFRSRTRPCLQYQINRCTAPCVAYVNKEEYQKQVQHATLFLEGKNNEIIEDITQKMEQAAEKFEFEKAAQYRDQIILLRKIQAKQYILSDKGNIDIIVAAEKMAYVAISILFVRGGLVIGNRTYFPKVPPGIDIKSVLSEFIPQYYLSPMRGGTPIEKIVVSETLPDRNWIQSALQEKLGHHFQIADKMTQRYKHWLSITKSNVEFALTQHLAQKKSFAIQFETLQTTLNLPNPVESVECFDISHTMGEETVASCVVFNAEGPIKSAYRRFNIRDITPGDDYAAIRQALFRHYTRVKEEDREIPDLIMIDGGLGQLNQAADVLEELQVSGVVLLAIAKGPERKAGKEELFIWGRHEPIHLDPHDIAFHLLQHIRNEAHRFAITAHRAKRAKKSIQSPLEEIENVGPKRRRELLRYFGGLQEIKKASIEEIAKVPGISESLAKQIYDALHE